MKILTSIYFALAVIWANCAIAKTNGPMYLIGRATQLEAALCCVIVLRFNDSYQLMNFVS
jgi:hypothetical protein